MTYTKQNYTKYLQNLQTIKGFDWVKNHLHVKEIPNFWTILEFGEEKEYGKRSAHEIRSSRMIRWLMDANETHNLGNVFAHKIMHWLGVDYPYHPEKNQMIKATAEEMDIDVFYRDHAENMCVAIELKQYAKEGTYEDGNTQLDKYIELVTELIEDADHPTQAYYIYLTPQGEEPSNENWQPMGYETLINIIEEVLAEHVENLTHIYAADTKKIITDFKYDLQRSMDYTSTKNKNINDMLSDEEKMLTRTLAQEIEHETDTQHLDELMKMNQGNPEELKELILIADKHITKQNSTPNDRIRVLIRKIYNYLSGDQQVDTVHLVNYNKEKSTTPLKQRLKDAYGLTVTDVQISGGKGQGIYLLDEHRNFYIYLSGDAEGHFPNDSIHLGPTPSVDEEPIVAKPIRAKHVKNKQFMLKDDRIYEDLIQYRKGEKTIPFDALMREHVMPAIKELDEAVQ